MRYLFGVVCLCVGQAFLWTWVDDGPRWMLGVAVTALVLHALVMAPGRDSAASGV
jgi:hypothetical protein